MFHEQGTTVVRKRLGFFSVSVLCLTAIIVTSLLTAGGIAVYGLNVIDKRSDNIASLVQDAVQALPEFCNSLPPALADAIRDERCPDYLENVDISVRFGEPTFRHGHRQAVVRVNNQGDEVISLMSMRVVSLNADGDPVREYNTWAATPIQIEDDWRGPIMPHETRQFSIWCSRSDEATQLSHEVTDIRVWRGSDGAKPATTTSDGTLARASD